MQLVKPFDDVVTAPQPQLLGRRALLMACEPDLVVEVAEKLDMSRPPTEYMAVAEYV